MEDLVDRMDRAAGTVRPNLAVRFTADPNIPLANRHGVLQHGCTFVGECVTGCNQGAKQPGLRLRAVRILILSGNQTLH
jgi:cholesterol oxidase